MAKYITMAKIIYPILFITAALFFTKCNTPNQEIGDKEGIKDSCCVKSDSVKPMKTALRSEITCPECGHKKMEEMPTDVCLLKYTCDKCNSVLHPKEGDCCVFCTYGTHKCPSMQ